MSLAAAGQNTGGAKTPGPEAVRQGQAETDEDEIIRVRTDEVALPVSVRDERGTPVAGLRAESFFIYDNGVRQQITSFNQRRIPANIILLLDASGSVFSQMRLIRLAAKRFAQELLPQDRVCVMQFADRVEVLQDWTQATEIAKLEKTLVWRYHAGQGTAFHEGLQRAASEQLSKVEGRRVIILLTDGIDTAKGPQTSFAEALNSVRRAEASVYVVSLTATLRKLIEDSAGTGWSKIFSGSDPREVSALLELIEGAERQLKELAEQTGGRLFLPLKDEDLLPAYQAIAEELRTQYIITYRPLPRVAAGEQREIRVLVSPGGYEVAARRGYLGRE
ncbi:MAG TPA: VWA domain-containing protein [Pyrinomonadaceae bacterium]